MNEFTIYCTGEQVIRALELGAPIEKRNSVYTSVPLVSIAVDDFLTAYIVPTAEQMLGWLRNNKINIDISYEDIWGLYTATLNYGIKDKWSLLIEENKEKTFSTFEEATLAAIDAALTYLTNNNK